MTSTPETIKFGGREFQLRPISIGGLRKIARRFKDGMDALDDNPADPEALDGMLDIIYLGLADSNKDFSREDFDALPTAETLDDLLELFGRILVLSGMRRKEAVPTEGADPLALTTTEAPAPAPAPTSSTAS